MKRRAWKWLLGILAGFALMVGAFLWSAHSRATAVFERHDARLKEAIAAIRARSGSRPPLFEPPISGNGWPLYSSALEAISAIPESESDEIPAMRGEPDFRPDREKLAEIFEKHAPLLEQLRTACRHDQFVPGYAYEEGFLSKSPEIAHSIQAAKFLAGLAEFLHEEVRDRAALEAVALMLGLGHDPARSGTILNMLILVVSEGIATFTARDILAGHSLEAADLEWFAGRLDRMWAARPTVADAFFVEDIMVRRTVVDLGTAKIDFSSPGMETAMVERSWRHLFSHRLACAGALDEIELLLRSARSAGSLAPHLRAEGVAGLFDQAKASKNPVVYRLTPSLGPVYKRDAVAQMSWTLMRVATAIAWYEAERGRVPEKLEDLVPRHLPRVPACPLTGLALGYRDGAVWSPGKNRVDDGGVPGTINDVDDEDGDVVWQVRRE